MQAEGGHEKARAEETTKTVRQTGASEFQRLYQFLADAGALQFLDNIDEEIWRQLSRGEVVEIEAVIRPTGLAKIADLFSQFEQIRPLAEAAGADALDSESLRVFDLIRQFFSSTGQRDSSHAIATLASSPEFTFSLHMWHRYMSVDSGLLEGEATVCGKIQRKLKPDETALIGATLGGLEEMLGDPEREKFAELFDDPQVKALGIASPLLRYPAAVLTPIAIYR